MSKHKFPKGITSKILNQIYDEEGYGGCAEGIYEDPYVWVNETSIRVQVNYYDTPVVVDTIWRKEDGFKFCPTWVYQELIKRGLVFKYERPVNGMPKELTAENGAKALLSGEFNEVITVENPSICECGECDDPLYVNKKVPVEWSTIKAIYNKVVGHYWED